MQSEAREGDQCVFQLSKSFEKGCVTEGHLLKGTHFVSRLFLTEKEHKQPFSTKTVPTAVDGHQSWRAVWHNFCAEKHKSCFLKAFSRNAAFSHKNCFF